MTAPKMTRLAALLWLDCVAGGAVGVAILTLASVLAPWLGLPRGVLVCTALANLLYGVGSLSLATNRAPSPRRVRALVAANFAWSTVCIALAIAYARTTRLGAAYFVLESLFVGGLALAEWRALRRRS